VPVQRVEAADNTIRLRARPSAADALPTSCLDALRYDTHGFTVFDVVGWRNDVRRRSGIVFARDLADHDAALLQGFEGWPLWRWGPAGAHPGALPELIRLGVVHGGSWEPQ
jgi:hypothetical protein